MRNCKAAMQYYGYLEDQLVRFNDNNTWVTLSRIQQVAVCKEDCNFQRLLSVNSLFKNNITTFALSMVSVLRPEVASQCKAQFPTLASSMGSVTASQLKDNIHQITFLTPNQLGSFSQNDSLALAQALTTNGKQLSKSMAKSIGSNIPANQPLDNIAGIASSVPLSVFNRTSPNTLVNIIGQMDVSNMDSFRKGFIATKVASSNDPTLILNLLNKTSDADIVNSISIKLINSLNIDLSSNSIFNIPKAYVK